MYRKNRQLINLHYLNATPFLLDLKWKTFGLNIRCDNPTALYVFAQYKRECRDYSIGFLFINFNQRIQFLKLLAVCEVHNFKKRKLLFPKVKRLSSNDKGTVALSNLFVKIHWRISYWYRCILQASFRCSSSRSGQFSASTCLFQ